MTELQTREIGLTGKEVKERQQQYGKNILPQAGENVHRLQIFLRQWKSPLILILLGAVVVSGVVGEYTDMIIIGVTAILNACIGFFQEDKASQALAKLQKMVTYKVVVMREGKKQQVAPEELVPGDILFLSAGDRIPADGRLSFVADLTINESVLTGESVPIRKQIEIITQDGSLGDRTNLVYRGTHVGGGRGVAIVTATGKETELGKIASLVQDTEEEPTPLEKELSHLGRQIGVVVAVICIGIFLLGFFREENGYQLLELFQTAVAVAVAAIPEGLMISLTVILAIGMQHILKRQALVRRLVAAETLGSVSVICTDKTGTLTEGIMRVTRLVTRSSIMEGGSFAALESSHQHDQPDVFLALKIGVLCSDAVVGRKQDGGEPADFIGDTTEVALALSGEQVGFRREHIEAVMPRVAEIPFTSEEKYMATLHEIDHEKIVYVKGAPEVVMNKVSMYEDKGETRHLTKKEREWFKNEEARMTRSGLRVLAVAYATFPHDKKTLHATDVSNLTIVGLIGLSDPLRSEVKETVRLTQAAGIRVIMLTGDHIETARTIGKELGLVSSDDQVKEGVLLDTWSDEDLNIALKRTTIFARVNPVHKIRIVQALQADGEVVAMTGDGVNDAPALKAADIGVAVGSGTDVAREVADVVLLHDSFSTIVAAVEEGRRIYENMKKVVLYLLAGSLAEVVIITASLIAGLPLPLLPAQILWINIIEELFPTMALAFDKGDAGNMKEKPRKKGQSFFDRQMKGIIVIMTIVTNIILFSLFVWFWRRTGDITLTRTIIFVTLGANTLFSVYALRSFKRHLWHTNPFTNWYVTAAVLFGLLLLGVTVYFPPFHVFLSTVPLSLATWGVVFAFCAINIIMIEMVKTFLVNKRIENS